MGLKPCSPNIWKTQNTMKGSPWGHNKDWCGGKECLILQKKKIYVFIRVYLIQTKDMPGSNTSTDQEKCFSE